MSGDMIKTIFFDIGGVLIDIHPEKTYQYISDCVDLSPDIIEKKFPWEAHNEYEKGYTIEGLPAETENLKVFHAGTEVENNITKTNGGRVLCVTALGKNTTEAQLNAYNYVERINWKGCFYRTDIGYRAIERE